MNKLINVNIGGIVFQIDELAYQKLDAYLQAIKKKYASSPEGDEIVRDIEIRIAEIFTEKFKGTSAAVMMHDVDEVIGIMGQPEDYETPGAKNTAEPEEEYAKPHRHFFRDGESRVLGGVCSGFAHYFGIDPLWLRLGFVVAFFFFGTGLLLYIVLWIIMPEAKTTAEKIEMRGEKVNISNIEKTIRDEAEQLKTRMKDFGDDVKRTFSKDNTAHARTSLGKFIEDVAHALGHVLKGIFKALVLFIVIAALVVLVVMGVSLLDASSRLNAQIGFVTAHVFDSSDQFFYVTVCALALFIIPLFAIVFSGIRYVIGAKKKVKGMGWVLSVLWTVALIIVIINAARLSRDFRYTGRDIDHVSVLQPENGKLSVMLDESGEKNLRSESHLFEDWYDIKIYDDTIIYRNINFAVQEATDSVYSVTIIKSAHGRSPELSKERADAFTYTIGNSTDHIFIPSAILLSKEDLFRNQSVDVIVKVPEGKSIQLDKKLEYFCDDDKNADNLASHEMFGKTSVMTASGLQLVND